MNSMSCPITMSLKTCINPKFGYPAIRHPNLIRASSNKCPPQTRDYEMNALFKSAFTLTAESREAATAFPHQFHTFHHLGKKLKLNYTLPLESFSLAMRACKRFSFFLAVFQQRRSLARDVINGCFYQSVGCTRSQVRRLNSIM